MLRRVEFIGSGYEVVKFVMVDTPTMAEAYEAAEKWYKDSGQDFHYCEMEIPKEYAYNESAGDVKSGMTEFERIKAMDVVDLAIYLADLQMTAVHNYIDNRRFPKGYFDHLDMLKSEAKVPDTSLEDTLVDATERSSANGHNEQHKEERVKE